MRATVVCMLACIALASAASNIRLGQIVSQSLKNEPKVAEVQAKLVQRKKQAQAHANMMSMKPIMTSPYRKCNFDSDCPAHQECVNYVPKLANLIHKTHASTEQFGTIYTQIKAQDKRCKDVTCPKMPVRTPREQIMFTHTIRQSMAVIREAYVKLNKSGLNMPLPPNIDYIDHLTMKSAVEFNTFCDTAPGVRTGHTAAAGLDMNTFLLISLLDDDSGSSSLTKLLPILLMSQGGTGMGGDLLSNPLLLISMLDDDSKSSDLLLIMTLMNGGGLGGSTDLLGSPLLLMTLLKDDSSSSMSKLLPILLLSGGLGGGMDGGVVGTGRQAGGFGAQPNMMSNPLLLLLLLDDNNNSSLSKLLPILLLGSMQSSGMPGGAGGLNQILPLILLLDNSTDISDLLLIMMVSGGGLGGAPGAQGAGDMSALLPILLLGDKLGGGLNDTKDLLLISLLGQGGMGGAGGGLNSILPFLLLSNSTALNTSDTLTMILLLSGAMGQQAGGAGAPSMNMLLPLLLGGGLNDTKDLLLIMMLGGAGGAGGAGMNSLLPLLLLGSNGTMDTTTLVLVMMMSQAQPGTINPIDGSTGLSVAPQSNLNSILPLLLLSKDGGLGGSDNTVTMLLLLNMLSQGTPSATSAGLVG